MATFFFDNDISFRIVAALRQLVPATEHELVALRDRFPIDAKDIDWIPEVGRNGWILISKDSNQRRRESEHSALKQHQVRALYIRQSPPGAELYADAARIIKNWPKIRDWGVNAKSSALCRLTTDDRIVQL